MGLVADGLVVFENALLDDGKLGGFHSIVVEARGGQAAIGGAIAPYIHQVAANAQRAHLVRGQEAGPGEVGLVAKGAIQLRGMPECLKMPFSMMGNLVAFTPSSSKPVVARPRSVVRSRPGHHG